MALDADLMLFDEPTSALDLEWDHRGAIFGAPKDLHIRDFLRRVA
jgi:energy-coupling factor transporter ATP-binding protein EcfA2